MKFLIWAVVGIVVVMWLMRKKPSSSQASAPAENAERQIEAMVQCAHCGVHIPASEARISEAGKTFCSEEHRLRHARA